MIVMNGKADGRCKDEDVEIRARVTTENHRFLLQLKNEKNIKNLNEALNHVINVARGKTK